MAGGRGRIPFLGSHGYFVSTTSDEEDNFDRSHEYCSYEKYWRGDKERSLQGAADEVSDDKNFPQIERSGWNQSFSYPALGKAGCVRFTCYPYADQEISNHVPSTEACRDCVDFQSMSVYFSSVQLRKSKACSEASNYSLQRSLELMARSTYTDMESDELAKKGSVPGSAKKCSKGCDTRSQSHHIIEPSREILACAVMRELPTIKQTAQVDHLEEISDAARSWSVSLGKATDGRVSGNCDDYRYHDPIDSELYYSHPRSFSQPEVKRLAEVQNAHYRNTSDLLIVDLEDNSEAAELYPSNTSSAVGPPLKERKGKGAYSTTNVAAYKRDYTRSQRLKESVSRKRSQEKGTPAAKKKYSTDDCGPTLNSLEPVKTFESDCLSREEQCLRTREKSFRDAGGDLVTSEGKEQRIQQTRVRMRPMMKVLMHMDNFSHTDRPFPETDHEAGEIGIECEQVPSSLPCPRIQKDKKDISTVATTEVAPHNAGKRKEFSTWQSSVESRETSQIEQVVLGLMDNLSTNTSSSSPEVITAPKHQEYVGSRGMVKLRVPVYIRNKEKILSKINQSRGVREIDYQRSDVSAGSNVIDIGRNEAESPGSKYLRRRQLQTLKVVDHNTPRSDASAVTKTLNLPEGSRRAGDLKGTACKKILTTDIIHLENSRTTRKVCDPQIDGEISSFFPEQENNAQSEILELEEKESIENMTAISEDQRLEMSSNPPPPRGEEKNSLLQHLRAESRIESYSGEVVQSREPFSELDVDVQSNTLLQLLREMQIYRPGPATNCVNTNIVKTGGMVDPAPQRGSYLAQYLKTQSRVGARRISVDK